MKLRPSLLPILAACPCFESDGNESVFTAAGTNRHKLAADYLKRGEIALDGIDDDEAGKVRWACKYILDRAPTSEFPLRIEERRVLLDDSFNEQMAGTPDITCGPHLFDIKSRPRGYKEQMAAYALMMFQEVDFPEIKVHLLFCEIESDRVFTLTKAQAEEIVNAVIQDAQDPARKPTACQYCNWCSKNLTCSALMKPAAEIAKARGADANDIAVFESFIIDGAHPSKIIDPGIMGVILRVMRVVAAAVKSAEHSAKEMAIKQGMVPDGFKLQSRAGKTFVTDVPAAFGVSGLPQEEFLTGCQLRLNTSKKYPDQLGLVDIYKKFHGIAKTTQAKKSLMQRLAPVLKQAQASMSLVAVKGEVEVEETEE